MYQDEIVKEIHKIREQYACSFNHDLNAIFADLQRQQAEGGREIVNLSQRSGSRKTLQLDVKDKSGSLT